MPPKGRKGGNAAKAKSGESLEAEEPLQALIIADSYEDRFLPFTLEHPRCLLKLANTPLIEYTCEWLASVGVEEVFVYSGNHTDQVESYFEHSRWTKDTSPFSLEVVRQDKARSVGDAMRDVDQKGLMRGDFICVYGDVIANIPLDAALRAHKARRERSKNAILAMVLREAGDYNRTKDQHHRRCFVIDPASDRCIHYEQVRPRRSPRLNIPEEVLKDHVEIDMREDLIDCGIDICTPDALAQWSDSFDWGMPRQDFVHGVLQDFETFGRTIHTHIVTEGYAARVNTLRAYDAITKDVVARWAYPYCPDTNILADQSYQLQKGSVYREDGVVLARSSTASRRCVLGKTTSIGEGSVVTNSVIGRRCVIGKRVKIENAYIWDDVRVGDDTVIETAIVANEASVGRNCHVKRGALVSYGVSVGDGSTIEENTRVTKVKRKRGYDADEVVHGATEIAVVGKDGVGFRLELNEDEEDVYEALLAGVQDMDITVGDDDFSDLDSLDSEQDDDGHEHSRDAASRSGSFTSIGSDESGESGNTKRDRRDFHHDASESIFDGLQNGQDPDNIQLELQALRLSNNAEDSQIRRAVAVAFNKRIANLIESGKTPKEAVTATIKLNQRLIRACVKETEEQAEFLLFMQTDLVHRMQGSKVLLFAANALIELDMVDEDGLVQWWENAKSSATEELEEVRRETKQVVDIMTAESEEEETDDEDE
ncbi:translation initiation factor eIF-2B epsilon subunit, GEF [Teratosphaeriaceae sp. CCFEE 6253]|nr:translation initiation factor eIF-2B epsilon subunit, GEF [Teratosphaeriaceae sp. CCFEE 6253]